MGVYTCDAGRKRRLKLWQLSLTGGVALMAAALTAKYGQTAGDGTSATRASADNTPVRAADGGGADICTQHWITLPFIKDNMPDNESFRGGGDPLYSI